jgi:hypothetical protein
MADVNVNWKYAAIIFAFIAIYCTWNNYYGDPMCNGCATDTAYQPDQGKSLLPIMNPLFNMREICKQSVLLEDHLFNPRKRCGDCIRKHFITMEAFAEEAITLDKTGEHKDLLVNLPETIRGFAQRVSSGENKHTVATDMRMLRKRLLPFCYNATH